MDNLFKNRSIYLWDDEIDFLGKEIGSTDITVTSVDNPSCFETITLNVVTDTEDPYIRDCYLIDNETIYMNFSENIDETFLLNKSNFSITKDPDGDSVAISSITNLTTGLSSSARLLVNLQTPLDVYDEITVTVDNLEDRSGNVISETTYNHGYVPPLNTVIDTSEIIESNGKFKLDAGAVTLTTNENYIQDYYNVLLCESGVAPYRYTPEICSIQSDGSTSDYFPDYMLDNDDYELYIYALYDIDGDFTTTDDQYPTISDAVQYTVTTGDDW